METRSPLRRKALVNKSINNPVANNNNLMAKRAKVNKSVVY